MYQEMYNKRKEHLLKDVNIHPKNREVIKEFLTFQEYKLKRKEGLTEVDERSYKTLYFYTSRINNLNKWFENKDWSKLTKVEIKKFIDDLEDGKIVNQYGKRYSDRSLYYQMLQGKFFGFVGKNHIVRDILEEFSIKGRRDTNQVRYIEEDDFKKIIDCMTNAEQRALGYLAWDIGENISSLLALEKEDLKRQTNTDTGEIEYLVILSKEKLKRSRTPRSELTNYPETVKYLDIVLENLKPSNKNTSNGFIKNRKLKEIHNEEKLFKFGWKAAEKFLRRAVESAGVRCLPGGERVTWKDLRSSMACDLLKKGWTNDEVNSRLGHRPSSRIIDRYINYLALDRKKSKKKIYEGSLIKVEMELSKQKEYNKLQALRMENLQKENEHMRGDFSSLMTKTTNKLKEVLGQVERLEKEKTPLEINNPS